jgi:Flp pilus assembly protein CpaB
MYASVTLALTPEEAEILTFSKDKGRINLALRPLGDRTREKVKLASFNELVQQIKNIEKGDEEIKHDFVMQTVRQKEPVPSGIAAETAIKPR